MSEIARYTFDNVKVNWAKVREDNFEPPYQGEGVNNWTLQVVLDDDAADAYKKTGLFPKFKRDQDHELVLDEGHRQVKLKKSTTFGVNGKPKRPPLVVDIYGNEFTGLIGNGSICNVQCSTHTWTRDGKQNTSLELQAVQVVDLVEYNEDEAGGDNFEATFDFKKQKKVPLKEVKVEEDLDTLDFDG